MVESVNGLSSGFRKAGKGRAEWHRRELRNLTFIQPFALVFDLRLFLIALVVLHSPARFTRVV